MLSVFAQLEQQRRRIIVRLLICLWGLTVLGCSSIESKVDRQAKEFGFSKLVKTGTEFDHVLYVNKEIATSPIVHIYIEGDGVPFINHHYISSDPTPAKPLMLRLMSLDTMPSLYVGRPCYFGLSREPGCTNQFWTLHRYSEPVVASMASVIHSMISSNQKLHLIGHSGGGALAVLLAERLGNDAQGNVVQVTTIAGNLNTYLWSNRHGYTPLYGSLNPSDRKPLPQHIKQVHIAGGRDDNIEADIIRHYVDSQISAEFWLYEEQKHACCWENIWQDILARLNERWD